MRSVARGVNGLDAGCRRKHVLLGGGLACRRSGGSRDGCSETAGGSPAECAALFRATPEAVAGSEHRLRSPVADLWISAPSRPARHYLTYHEIRHWRDGIGCPADGARPLAPSAPSPPARAFCLRPRPVCFMVRLAPVTRSGNGSASLLLSPRLAACAGGGGRTGGRRDPSAGRASSGIAIGGRSAPAEAASSPVARRIWRAGADLRARPD